MRERLFLKLNKTERKILQHMAEKKGFKDYRTLIHRKIHALPAEITKDFTCDKDDFKTAKPIPLSPELLKYLSRLSCYHCTDVTSIVYRYVIYPEIKEWMTSIPGSENHNMGDK